MRLRIDIDRLSVDVFHHQIRMTVIAASAIDQPGDIRMVEARQNLSLSAKTGSDVGAPLTANPVADQLDRHLFVERGVGASRFEHGAHTALRNFAGDFVSAEATAYPALRGRVTRTQRSAHRTRQSRA